MIKPIILNNDNPRLSKTGKKEVKKDMKKDMKKRDLIETGTENNLSTTILLCHSRDYRILKLVYHLLVTKQPSSIVSLGSLRVCVAE
jgi:bacterioferritin (cytochrome b1)